MIVDDVDVVTAAVFTVNVAVADPMATDTLAGTVADLDDDASLTVIAALFVVALNVTVPVEELPPTKEAGDSAKLETK